MLLSSTNSEGVGVVKPFFEASTPTIVFFFVILP